MGTVTICVPECQRWKRLPDPLRGRRRLLVSANDYDENLESHEVAGICDEWEVISALFDTPYCCLPRDCTLPFHRKAPFPDKAPTEVKLYEAFLRI